MLKLDRTSVDAPPCLADYNHPTHEWSDFRGEIEAARWLPYATTIRHFLQR